MAWTTAEMDRLWNPNQRHHAWDPPGNPAPPPLWTTSTPLPGPWPAVVPGTSGLPARSEAWVKDHATAASDYLRNGLRPDARGRNRIATALDQLNGHLEHKLPLSTRAPSLSGTALYEHYLRRAKDELPSLRAALFELLDRYGWRFPNGQTRIPVGVLSTADFYGVIAQYQHLKDIAIGQEHGEWTHLLQWYCLTVQPPSHDFDVRGFYQYLGLDGAATAQPTSWGPPLWQLVCDRTAPYYHLTDNYYGFDIHDFRCPDMFHVTLAGLANGRTFLLTNPAVVANGTIAADMDHNLPTSAPARSRERWPLLCALLRRRLMKRDGIYAQGIQNHQQLLTSSLAQLKADLAAITVTLNDGTTVTPVNVPASDAGINQWSQDRQLSWRDPGVLSVDVQVINQITGPPIDFSILDPVRLRMEAYRAQQADPLHRTEALFVGAMFTLSHIVKDLNRQNGTTMNIDPTVAWPALSPAQRTHILTTTRASPFHP